MTTRMTALLALLAVVLLAACATRNVETRILNDSGVEVFLCHRLEGGQEVERGYAHPLTIPAERLSIILSRIEVESDQSSGFLGRKTTTERREAIAAPLLEPVSLALAEALAQAGPNQEIALRAVDQKRRIGVFVRKFATGFTAFAKDDALHLKFSFVDWEVPVVDDVEENQTLPKPGDPLMALQVLPGRDMQVIGSREVAVRWRSASFDYPESQLSERRSPPERHPEPESPRKPAAKQPAPEAVGSEPALPPHLSSETLGELADLKQAREEGEISESYYQRQREKLLKRGVSSSVRDTRSSTSAWM